MPRYLVERLFRDDPLVAAIPHGSDECGAVIERNLDAAVTWLHSYVSVDETTAFCVYESPSPEAIRHAAALNRLPVDRITRVRVLDPYFTG